MPQGLLGQVTAVPADKPSDPPGRRWASSGTTGDASMQVDDLPAGGMSDNGPPEEVVTPAAAAAAAQRVADEAEAATRALRTQTAEAAQAAAIAKKEAAKLTATAGGFIEVGKGGKAVTS
jgi:hypothetical protein